MKYHIILFLLSSLLFACNDNKEKSHEHHAKAKQAYKNDSIKNALTEIELAIALDSTNLDYLITKAKIIQETNNYENALEILNNVSSRNFKSDTVNFELGSCFFRYSTHFSIKQSNQVMANQKLEKALFFYDNAISSNPQYYLAYEEKIRALNKLNRYDQALITINTALILFPDSLQLILLRGVAKTSLGDYTSAVSDFNLVIENEKINSSDKATAYRFEAWYHSKEGQIDLAIDELTKAITLNPKDHYCYAARAECFISQGLVENACQDYRTAANLGFVEMYYKIKFYCTN